MTTTPVPKLITRDELLRYEPQVTNYSVTLGPASKPTANLRLLCWDGASGYAISVRSGMVYRVELTSLKGKVRGGMRSVNVWPARDTGDQAGTLAFDADVHDGWVWAGLATSPT